MSSFQDDLDAQSVRRTSSYMYADTRDKQPNPNNTQTEQHSEKEKRKITLFFSPGLTGSRYV